MAALWRATIRAVGRRPSPVPRCQRRAIGTEGGTASQLEHHREDDEQPGHADDESRHGEGAKPDRAERGERGVLELGRRQRDIATVTCSADRERGARPGSDGAVACVPRPAAALTAA